MSRRFNGTSDKITFPVTSATQGLTAGDLTLVIVLDLNDTVDGALIHAATSGSTTTWWMESFGGVWNFGTASTARNVGSLSAADGWCVLVGRKAAGGTSNPRGRKIILGGSTTDVTAASTMVDGSAPGAGGIITVAQFPTTEFLSADIAAVAIFARDVSDADTATFTTYANLLAGGAGGAPAWCVAFDQASPTDPVDDDSPTGTGGSLAITGTTIVADPPGFFAGAAGAAPSGIAVSTALGLPTAALNLTAAPAGVAIPVALGTPIVTRPGVAPSGIAVPIALGTPTVTRQSAAPAGIAVPATLGTPAVSLNRSAAPSGIAVPIALGNPTVVAGAYPAGIAVPVVLGQPTVTRGSAAPSGIAVPVALGAPAGALARAAAPAGIAMPVALGAPQAGAAPPAVDYRTAVLTAGALTSATLTAGARTDATLTPGSLATAALAASTL